MSYNGNPLTMTGTVIFLKQNTGSKSEGVYPFLYQTREKLIQIRIENDNPFENRGLSLYDGKTVEVTGVTGQSGVFLINKIKVVASAATDSNFDAKESDDNSQQVN